MSRKNDIKSGNSKSSLIIWLAIVVLIVGGVVANSFYSQVAGALRAAGGIVLAIVILGLASLTPQGKLAWTFIKNARIEMRKVVWPTRQETTQTTLVVVGMVVVTSIILWGIDSLFLWLISFLTGQRG